MSIPNHVNLEPQFSNLTPHTNAMIASSTIGLVTHHPVTLFVSSTGGGAAIEVGSELAIRIVYESEKRVRVDETASPGWVNVPWGEGKGGWDLGFEELKEMKEMKGW